MAGPRSLYQAALDDLDDAHESGEVTTDDYELIRDFVFTHDRLRDNYPGEERSDHTLRAYTRKLTHTAKNAPGPLHELTAEEVNRFMSACSRGEIENMAGRDGDGLSTNTVRQYQNILRKFYEHHDELEPEKDELSLRATKTTVVKEEDILSESVIEDLQDAIDNSRDRALFAFLINTGQRFRALQALRIKDIDLDEGEFRMPDVQGLKGARRRMVRRSLFGAKGPIRRWIQDHPTGNPDHFLFTGRPSTGKAEPEDEMSPNAVQMALRRIAEDAGYDPSTEISVNPHNFRHTWATRAYLKWGFAKDEIKAYLGHRPDSKVFETTYRHLSDRDYNESMEQKLGMQEPEPDEELDPFKPCPNCGEMIERGAKACGNCGSILSPDAADARDHVKEKVRDEKEQADTLEEYRDADAIAQALEDDPALAAKLMDKLEGMAGDE